MVELVSFLSCDIIVVFSTEHFWGFLLFKLKVWDSSMTTGCEAKYLTLINWQTERTKRTSVQKYLTTWHPISSFTVGAWKHNVETGRCQSGPHKAPVWLWTELWASLKMPTQIPKKAILRSSIWTNFFIHLHSNSLNLKLLLMKSQWKKNKHEAQMNSENFIAFQRILCHTKHQIPPLLTLLPHRIHLHTRFIIYLIHANMVC